jgi:hypothetical protein
MRGAEEDPTEAYSEYAAGSGPTRQRSRWAIIVDMAAHTRSMMRLPNMP